MKKHKYLFVACLSLFPIMVVAENDTRNEIAEVWAAANINKTGSIKVKWWMKKHPSLWWELLLR